MSRFDVLLCVLILITLFGNPGPLIPTNVPAPVWACIILVVYILLLVLGNVQFG